MHSTYAAVPEREPFGVLNAWMWARGHGHRWQRGDQKKNLRWIEDYKRIAGMAADFPGTRLVYVGDAKQI